MSTTYSFPTMGIQDLVCQFRDMEIEITEADYLSPKRERWEKLYVQMIAQATDSQIAEVEHSLAQFEMQGLTQIAYPDLHQDSVPLFNLCKAMQKVMLTCLVEDFKMSDILEPKKNRLVKISSGLCNFLLFKSCRLEVYHRLKEENMVVAQQKNALLAENDDLQSRISKIKAQKVEQEPIVKRLHEDVLARTAQLEELHKTATELKKKQSDAKTLKSEKKAHLGRLNEHIAGLKEESNRLSSQIVLSPERMKKDTDRMTNLVKQLTQSNQDKRQILMSMSVKTDNLGQCATDCEQALGLINVVSENKKKAKDLSMDIRQMNDEILSTRDKINDFASQEQHLKREMATKSEKLQKMSLQQNNKQALMRGDMERALREREALSERQSEENLEVSMVDIERQKVTHDLNELLRKHETVMATMKEKYTQLIKQVDEYHAMLSNHWQQACKV